MRSRGTSGVRDGHEQGGRPPMVTFTKICLYCGSEFSATYSLANICSPDCQKRTYASLIPKPQPRVLVSEAGRVESRTQPKPKPKSKPKPKPAGVDRTTDGTTVECRRCGKAMRDDTGTRKYCSS